MLSYLVDLFEELGLGYIFAMKLLSMDERVLFLLIPCHPLLGFKRLARMVYNMMEFGSNFV